jgi:hypothetical protein
MISLLTIILVPAVSHAADPEPALVHACAPWPNCQLDHLVISPGAPGTGLRPQERPGLQMQDMAPDRGRGSLRLPSNVNINPN